jgi:beta-N-acetylhexosaminidase
MLRYIARIEIPIKERRVEKMTWWMEEIRRMGIEEKVGQLICSSTWGDMERTRRLVEEGKVGSIILYRNDMPSPEATIELTNSLQELAKVPLFIMADFESGAGGMVPGMTMLPTNMAVGATRSEEFSWLCGEITAREARAIGVNVVLAPVVDVNANPRNPIINIRSFGEDPEMVGRLGSAWVEGCQTNRCMAVAKHFPGHGDTYQDSHREMPVVPHDMERMRRVELSPFGACIAHGVRGIMTAHIHFPVIDQVPIPATLSKKIVTDLLRRDMGFDGIVMTDAMAMWAIKRNFDLGEAAVMAVEAGVDIILAEDAEREYEAIMKAVSSGRIPEGRIDESVSRILKAKQWLHLERRRGVSLEDFEMMRLEMKGHMRQALNIAKGAVTAVKGKEFLRTIRSSTALLSVAAGAIPEGWEGELRSRFHDVVSLRLSEDPSPEEISKVMESVPGRKTAIFLTSAAPEAYKEEGIRVKEGQRKLVEELSARLPTIVISLGSPYVLADFPSATTMLCTYSDCSASIEALVEILWSSEDPQGRLPVSI